VRYSISPLPLDLLEAEAKINAWIAAKK